MNTRIKNNIEETKRKLEIFKKNNWQDTSQDRFKKIIHKTKDFINNNTKILDVGCRGGFFFDELRKYTDNGILYGTDISKDAIKILKSKDYKGKVSDIQEQKLNKKFDLIYLAHVLEHCDQPLNVLKNVYEMLNKNGYLYIEVPKRKKDDDKDSSHFYQFENFNKLNDLLIFDLFINKNNRFECIYAQDDFPIIGIYKKN